MKLVRYLLGFLALSALLVVWGCNGPSPGLDPVVSFTFADAPELPNLAANGVLQITADAGVQSGDQVTDVQWIELPQPGGETIGTFTSPTTLSTNWAVLESASITVPTPVTLQVTVETLNGGKTVTPLNLIVNPVVPAT